VPPDGIQSQHSPPRGVSLQVGFLLGDIRQTATGLEVGKAYGLQFVTADVQDVTEKKPYLE